MVTIMIGKSIKWRKLNERASLILLFFTSTDRYHNVLYMTRLLHISIVSGFNSSFFSREREIKGLVFHFINKSRENLLKGKVHISF